MTRLPYFLIAVIVLSGCTVGYRHTRHGTTHTRDDGKQLKIEGQGNSLNLGAAIDFRYFRFMVPFEGTYRLLKFKDASGNPDRTDTVRERRLYRLDIPVLSLWNKKEDGLRYPGNLRHRDSVELWISAESDLAFEQEWWADVGLVWYRYNGVGLRFYVGGGAVPFRAATPQVNSRFPILWDGYAPMLGIGIEATFTAGEFGYDAVQYLLNLDRRHRERSRKYGWD